MVCRHRSGRFSVCLCVAGLTLFILLLITRLSDHDLTIHHNVEIDGELSPLVFYPDHIGPFFLSPVLSRPNGEYRAKVLYNIDVHEDEEELKQFKYSVKKRIVFLDAPSWISATDIEKGLGACAQQACEISKDVLSADAVVFDLLTLRGVKPPNKPSHQSWVLLSLHPPRQYDFSDVLTLWNDKFNWTMSYRLDSDIVIPSNVLFYNPTKKKDFGDMFQRKTGQVLWVTNDCNTPSMRERYVEQLRRHITVDVYAACGESNASHAGLTSFMTLQQKYKFYLAFEKDLCVDFITDELFQTFHTDIIPVVRSGAQYGTLFPHGTYINTADYAGPADLARYLLSLETNVTEYVHLLKRKSLFQLSSKLTTLQSGFCDLCIKLHNLPYFENRYFNIHKWMTDRICKNPSDL
ncbi:alpha-(1,3)-fucosyltransferase C-like [Haliotis cracherodii]|uniref:alpha-(1,3)-fucosyltransferase C-like n=1 Tax=Haliotis cracherodii TaxID=6455 RepID=UPI0039EA24F1